MTSTCTCNDHQLDQLRDLIARGFDQADASRLLWGDQTPVSNVLTLEQVRRYARRVVRGALLVRLPWLRLPHDDEEVHAWTG